MVGEVQDSHPASFTPQRTSTAFAPTHVAHLHRPLPCCLVALSQSRLPTTRSGGSDPPPTHRHFDCWTPSRRAGSSCGATQHS